MGFAGKGRGGGGAGRSRELVRRNKGRKKLVIGSKTSGIGSFSATFPSKG